MLLVTVVGEGWAGSLVHSVGSFLLFNHHDVKLLPAREFPINFVLGTFGLVCSLAVRLSALH